MFEIYLLGAFLVLIYNVVYIFITFLRKFSPRTRNFEKTGSAYYVVDGSFQENPRNLWVHFFCWVNVFVFAPAFSWIQVVYIVWTRIYALVNKVSVPEKVKEIQYQLAASDLPKDKVIELLDEMARAMGHTGFRLAGEDEDADSISIRGDDFRMDLDRSNMQFTISSHTDDYHSSYCTVCEYKFDDLDVLIRTKDKWSTYLAGEKEYEIQDNVVMESDIRKRHAEKTFSFLKPDEIIPKLKQEAEWQKVILRKQKYFIMYRHRDKFPPSVFRSYIRGEKERIINGLREFKEILATSGEFELMDTEEGYDVSYLQSGGDKAHDTAVFLTSDENLKPYDMEHNDLWQAKVILAECNKYLEANKEKVSGD